MKNGERIGKSTRFSKTNQPSPKAKSKGWDKRRLAQSFMDKVFEMQDMTIAEFERFEKDLKKNKQSYTVRDLMAKNYIANTINSEKMIIDWLDRYVGKATKYEDPEPVANAITHVKVNVINKHRPPEEMEKD